MRRAVAVASAAAAAAGAGLSDEPIAGEAWQSLDGDGWTASLGDLSIPARVPGDLVTDLFRAGAIPEPLFENNFKNSTPWGSDGWVYTTHFDADPRWVGGGRDDTETLLVFDSVKMGARVALNGVALGTTRDQFVRYEFPLRRSGALRPGRNEVTVTFDESISTGGRFMACTGGWDWGPYTTTYAPDSATGDHTFSKGIVRSAYVVHVAGAAMTDVVVHTQYDGGHPTAPLTDGGHAGFTVRARVHFWSPAGAAGTLRVAGEWGAEAAAEVALPAGESAHTVTLRVPPGGARLWWPRRDGAQPLYRVDASFAAAGHRRRVAHGARRIGFRDVALVTVNDSDPAAAAAARREDGSGDLGMFFRVNGAAVFARGANMIPMDEQEGRYDAAAHRRAVVSAAEGGMNTLRVWGGGVFLPPSWYDACDEHGVMVWHDMMFTTTSKTHEPQGTADEEVEIRQAVRRLGHRPSIVMWNTCNECSGGGEGGGTVDPVYIDFVMTKIVEEDQSRPVWPASPSAGWDHGVHRLTGRPNGEKLAARDPVAFFDEHGRRINAHGWYQNGNGFEAVNQFPAHTTSVFDPQTPTDLAPYDGGVTGPGQNNSFNSEYGASVMSSFESMSPTLRPEHWSLHGGAAEDSCVDSPVNDFWKVCTGASGDPLESNVMAQRNYPCDNTIQSYFGDQQDLSAVGEAAFRRQLWQCMLSQALYMKAEIEKKRAQNIFGQLIWQLNEIWPTGGWGSIEYGTPGIAGQATGGRWKPLHHMLRDALFADVFAACGAGGVCFVRNDAAEPFAGEVRVTEVAVAGGRRRVLHTEPVSLPPGAGQLAWFRVAGWGAVDAASSAVVVEVAGAAGVASRHATLLAPPKELRVPVADVAARAARRANRDGSVDVTVEARGAAALFVTLTTPCDGRFSDNVFELLPGEPRSLRFLPFGTGPADAARLRDTLRVDHLAMHLAAAPRAAANRTRAAA